MIFFFLVVFLLAEDCNFLDNNGTLHLMRCQNVNSKAHTYPFHCDLETTNCTLDEGHEDGCMQCPDERGSKSFSLD